MVRYSFLSMTKATSSLELVRVLSSVPKGLLFYLDNFLEPKINVSVKFLMSGLYLSGNNDLIIKWYIA